MDGYLGYEPAVTVAANLGIWRAEAGFVYAISTPFDDPWLQPTGPRLELGLGLRWR